MISKVDSYNIAVNNINKTNKTNNLQDIKATDSVNNITNIADTVNIDKVNMIRNAILNGEYELDMRLTAEKLVKAEFSS
jgi:anti-sigma28 factor (negative regulator of flagellin synthesis)